MSAGPSQSEAQPARGRSTRGWCVVAHLRVIPRMRRIRRWSPPAQRRVQCAAGKMKAGSGGRGKRSCQPGRETRNHACSTGRAPQLLLRQSRTLGLPTSAACCVPAGIAARRCSRASARLQSTGHFKKQHATHRYVLRDVAQSHSPRSVRATCSAAAKRNSSALQLQRRERKKSVAVSATAHVAYRCRAPSAQLLRALRGAQPGETRVPAGTPRVRCAPRA